MEGHGNRRGGWFRPLHPGHTPLSRVNGLLGMGSGTDWYDPVDAHGQPCQVTLESYEGTRGLAIMLGSDAKLEWIEGMETADAVRREKRKDP